LRQQLRWQKVFREFSDPSSDHRNHFTQARARLRKGELMLNNRIAAARIVAQALNGTENAVDDAIVSVADLTRALAEARRVANVSPVVGQEAIALTAEAFTALQLARAKMVEAHSAFAEVRDGMGLKERASGDMWKIAGRSALLGIVGKAA
jgi:hypothetical protein